MVVEQPSPVTVHEASPPSIVVSVISRPPKLLEQQPLKAAPDFVDEQHAIFGLSGVKHVCPTPLPTHGFDGNVGTFVATVTGAFVGAAVRTIRLNVGAVVAGVTGVVAGAVDDGGGGKVGIGVGEVLTLPVGAVGFSTKR
jgi:hypothetical protein